MHIFIVLVAVLIGCDSSSERDGDERRARVYVGETIPRPMSSLQAAADALAGFCLAIDVAENPANDVRWLRFDPATEDYRIDGETVEQAQRFYFQAAQLGIYLLYDPDGQYLIDDDGQLGRTPVLTEEVGSRENTWVSAGEWVVIAHDENKVFSLRNRKTGRWLSPRGLSTGENPPENVAFREADACQPHPELTLDADGTVQKTHFDDGDLFGIVDTHSHIFSNLGFGPGVHGAPFHRLGVSHALNDCREIHGKDGRRDLWGYFNGGGGNQNIADLITAIAAGETTEFNHHTDGYPSFTDWPSIQSKTHQTQYYRWLERAWMGGLRLMVQHAVSNRVICQLQAAVHPEPDAFDCHEMSAIERSIEQTYALQSYIDAQAGGEGLGFFRIVTTPAEARSVIGDGKLAIVLGIETSNLFDCFSTNVPGEAPCDQVHVDDALAKFHGLGVRALFPVHKFDNGFTAGDGHRGILELANFINGGQWSSFIQACDVDAPGRFDQGAVFFGGLNKPRDEFSTDAAVDVSGFAENPLNTLLPYLNEIQGGQLDGDWCQNHGLTALGEYLLVELMDLGMIIEFDHFPRRAYARAFQMVKERGYPPMASHGETFDGRVYEAGGLAKANIGRCHTPGEPAKLIADIRKHLDEIEAHGGYAGIGFGFDLGGFSSYPKPRFGDRATCEFEQTNPMTYPFTGYGGDIIFTAPRIASRDLDFNREGLVHIGLLPELIEDTRRGGVSDAELEPLFRSAEGYIRMWERAYALRKVE
ncbi:MAG: hypothetical protein VX589_19660 [Myxococcota bacterium]|nr:hypothetical protein [Myxococcota bacterium]